MKLSYEVLTEIFPEIILRQGQRLVEQRAVDLLKTDYEYDHHAISVQGPVKSLEENNVSHVELQFSQKSQGITVQGGCSCSKEKPCEHMAAMAVILLSLLPESFLGAHRVAKPQVNDLFQQWLQDLKSDLLTGESTTSLPLKHYAFRLFPNWQMGERYVLSSVQFSDVEVFLEGHTQTGRKAKPKRLVLSELLDQFNYGYNLSEEMKAAANALRALQACRMNAFSDDVQLAGSNGYQTLQTLILEQQAYFQQDDQPLRWLYQPCDLPLEVIDQSEDQARLGLALGESQVVILCEPPIVLDLTDKTAQTVNTSVDSEVLIRLLDMPLGPMIDLKRLIDWLVQHQASQSSRLLREYLPLPVIPGFEPLVIEAVPPQVIFGLHQDDLNPLFSLQVRYGEHLVDVKSFDEIVCLQVQERTLQLKRHLECEQRAIERLAQWLVPIDPSQLKMGFDSALTSDMLLWALPEELTSSVGLEAFLQLQEQLPTLKADGWLLQGFEQQTLEVVEADRMTAQAQPQNDWFELRFDLQLADQTLPLGPVMQQLIGRYQQADALPDEVLVRLNASQVLKLSAEQVRPIFAGLLQLYGRDLPEVWQVHLFESHLMADLKSAPIHWVSGQSLLELSQKLADFDGIQSVTPPGDLQAKLRPYQQLGLNWLQFLYDYQFNGVLADDMGLGKTLQTLTWLAYLKQIGALTQPALLVVPTSLIGNWKAEAKRFVPSLQLLSLQGADRQQDFAQIPQADLVVTSYPLLPRDEATFVEYRWSVLILDEAQKIKNPTTKLYGVLMKLNAQHRLCLSGTPVENNLAELWSLFNFLMPGFLGSLAQFRTRYQKPVEQEGDRSVQRALSKRIEPFLLRRTKHQVVTELPDKTEIVRMVEFESDQANLYETIRLTMEQKVKQVVEEKGLAKSHITLLDALLKLRQVCCDPGLVKMDLAKKVTHSAKLELLMDLVLELLEGEHRILIFSQFTSMLKIIEARLKKVKIQYSLLTGQTRKREEAIEKFRSGQVPIFLISLKAGGTGLNLTEADTVIHYDPWWNPAVENQATDRAYRIGQDKEVFVYKLVVAHSIEEKILQLQAKKQALQDNLYQNQITDDESAGFQLEGEALLQLLQTDD